MKHQVSVTRRKGLEKRWVARQAVLPHRPCALMGLDPHIVAGRGDRLSFITVEHGATVPPELPFGVRIVSTLLLWPNVTAAAPSSPSGAREPAAHFNLTTPQDERRSFTLAA